MVEEIGPFILCLVGGLCALWIVGVVTKSHSLKRTGRRQQGLAPVWRESLTWMPASLWKQRCIVQASGRLHAGALMVADGSLLRGTLLASPPTCKLGFQGGSNVKAVLLP